MSDPDVPATIVVFDVNVYMDVASLLGLPFTWARFDAKAKAVANQPVPAILDERVDSLRAISYARLGFVIPGEPIEVWTSKHIDDLLVHKTTQSANGPTPETRGLGWSRKDALDLLERLVRDLVYDTYGDSVGELRGHRWHPPLEYEDGYIFETAYKAGDDELSPRLCVTRDGPFRQTDLGPRVTIMHPDEFITYLRQARRPPPGFGPGRAR